MSPQACSPGPQPIRAATSSPSLIARIGDPDAGVTCAPQWKSPLSPSGKNPPSPRSVWWYSEVTALALTRTDPSIAYGSRGTPDFGGVDAAGVFASPSFSPAVAPRPLPTLCTSSLSSFTG